ncbi:hypothetical protein HOY80DRAFT_885612 [Tuber brumale]|nr:hypothetical protein HOY80DRAFT_885612 [Tuber brumale]
MAEDAATVLEQFIHDVANLPAEIAHIYEEIQAKDRILKEHRDSALARDNSLQKHIKMHGSHVEHPKEALYVEQIKKAYEKIKEIQDEKVLLAHKADDLVEKHMKRLDAKITDLTRDGLMPPDSLLPSPYLKNLPVSAFAPRQPMMRASPMHTARTPSQHPTANPAPAAVPAHITPAATPVAFPAPQNVSTPRDFHENKRRRLTAPPNTVPAISSNLASHPSTPGIRPDPLGQPRRSSTPNVNMKKRKNPPKREPLSEDDDDDDDDELDEEGGEDKRLYCTCQQVSYGNMVACDDGDCPYEWFHWACVNLTKEPPGKWFCPTCAQRRDKMKSIRG